MLDTNDLLFLRILNELVAAIGFGTLSFLFFKILNHRGTGHRRLVLIGAVMFGMRSLTLLFVVRATYIHNHMVSVWVSSFSAVLILLCAFYVFATRKDIIKTLCRSEVVDQIWEWRIAGAKQIAMNTKYIAETTLENVNRLSPH